MKATAIAPSNIAFIKYWGVRDVNLRIPANGSTSMNLSNLLTTTTVEFNESFTKDMVLFTEKESENNRILAQIDRIRKLANITTNVKVKTENNFPTSTGLSSSASGFAALTVAATKAVGLQLSEKELSILARQGSGSACRSIPDGFVEWIAGDSNESSYAVSLYPPDYWDVVDIVACVSTQQKEVSSTQGHQLANTSPFFEKRLEFNKQKIQQIKQYLQKKDFTAFGELVESEALELHAIYLTSQPSLIYLLPESLALIQLVRQWRREGLEVYFTLNTGQDVHILCQGKDVKKVEEKLLKVKEVQKVIINYPTHGTKLSTNHLF